MYCFSVDAIANYHKLNGLNNLSLLFYSAVGYNSDMGLTGLV